MSATLPTTTHKWPPSPPERWPALRRNPWPTSPGIRTWDLAIGETACTLEGHSGWILAVAVLSGGRVVSGSTDHTLRVWDAATGKTSCLTHKETTWQGPAARRLGLLLLQRPPLRVWDTATGIAVARLTLEVPPAALAVVGEREIAAGDVLVRLYLLRLEDPS